jgi:hypothetical protein
MATPRAVDDLQIAAPVAAPAGSPVTVSAILTRYGAPVPGVVVSFVMSAPATGAGGGDASVADVTMASAVGGPVVMMMSAITGLDGTASLVLPPSTTALPGSTSIVTASVDEGRALGAKGDVPIMSPDAIITWQ